MNSQIIVIGAGSLGTNTAIFLARLGYKVTLLESSDDILCGASQVTFINHADGFEYFKPGHTKTGEYCVEGSLTKALFYPLSALTNGVCSEKNPIRFMVALGAIQAGLITGDGFIRNAEHMRDHYGRMLGKLSNAAGLGADEAIDVFVRAPESFMRRLEHGEFADIEGALTGVFGVGFGVNMPHYYALLKAALRRYLVSCSFNVATDQIRKLPNNRYEVCGNGQSWEADHVLVCNSHHIPQIVSRIHGDSLLKEFPGTYFLNCMTFLRLPKTADRERLRLAKSVTFTLLDDHGCMLAAIVPPTPDEDGLAAVYYPSPEGSQLFAHVCYLGDVSSPPAEWDEIIQTGLPADHPNVQKCFEQACKLHPFLRGYAEISHALCRTVFNVGVPGSDNGLDRRVRELSGNFHALTQDRRVSGWTTPKWTNAELSALMAVDYVLQQSGMDPLPKSKDAGCGPTMLDVGKISRMFNFRDLKASVEDAKHYARVASLPERIVREDLPQFQP
jgi:glycine/D-amino acid oxidase-like deaminating enzyme